MQHLGHHRTLTLNFSAAQTLHLWDQPWVLHHVRHELRRIPSDRVELQPRIANKGVEDVMGCQSDTMAITLKFIS